MKVYRNLEGRVESYRESERPFLFNKVFYLKLDTCNVVYLSDGKDIRAGDNLRVALTDLIQRKSGGGNKYSLALRVKKI